MGIVKTLVSFVSENNVEELEIGVDNYLKILREDYNTVIKSIQFQQSDTDPRYSVMIHYEEIEEKK